MKIVRIVGMGTGLSDLGTRHHEAIASADILVGAERHLELFADHPAEKIKITPPLAGVINFIRQSMADKQVVVLASGDPMFYGIGKTLAANLGEKNVEIVPNVSMMAEAFSRIKKSWADAVAVSLHGRDAEPALTAALSGRQPVFLYTDPKYTPARIAALLSERAPEKWHMCVFERLGEADESITWFSPGAAKTKTFQEPNAVILLPDANPQQTCRPVPGAPDDAYLHDRGMITKSEVRVIALAKLRLAPGNVMWDLGAGSGAVAIEAACFITKGKIIAVEKNPARIDNIYQNIRKFALAHIEVHQLTMPEGLQALPVPDRIFVGGGGGDLPEILRLSAKYLSPGGRIVVNVVVVETLAACMNVFKNLGFESEVVQIQIGKGSQMPSGTRISATNPVFVISAEKPLKQDCTHIRAANPSNDKLNENIHSKGN